MIINVDSRDRRPLYVQIIDEVKRALVVGTLKPGDMLPSVQGLATQLVINPRTVLQAYGELEREGVVYARRGQGTFVSEGYRPDEQEGTAVTRAIAQKALWDARRNGIAVEELVKMIIDSAEQEAEPSAATHGREEPL